MQNNRVKGKRGRVIHQKVSRSGRDAQPQKGPGRQDVPWVQFVAKLLSRKLSVSLTGMLFFVASAFSILWMLFESAGIRGSLRICFFLLMASVLAALAVTIVLRFLRWKLLFASVKAYIRRNELNKQMSEDTVLVGAGAGGALAVGMVSKALQELGNVVPHSFVIDCQYRGKQEAPKTGLLLPDSFTLSGRNVFIIHSYLGTGQSLKCVREVLGINDAPVFSFVISEALVDREDIGHYLVVGERAIIPWKKSSP